MLLNGEHQYNVNPSKLAAKNISCKRNNVTLYCYMENETISKKELLDTTGITYGQLYRWKRKSLIPDEWFIRKSTFTGQETYFPKRSILERIAKIKNLKDESSLDELANVFSPAITELRLKKEFLTEYNIVTQSSYKLLEGEFSGITELSLKDILKAYIIDKILTSGDAAIDEVRSIMELLNEEITNYPDYNCELYLIRKSGVSFSMLLHGNSKFSFEKNIKIVAQINLLSSIEELKIKLKEKQNGF